MVNKLTDESNETIDEEKPTPAENENSYKCNFCTVDTVLFSIFFTINVGISAYFPHYKYMNRKKINISKYYDYFCHRKSYWYNTGEVKKIKVRKLTYYVYNDIIDLEKFDARLLKIDKKSYWHLQHWIHQNFKNWWLWKNLYCESIVFEY